MIRKRRLFNTAKRFIFLSTTTVIDIAEHKKRRSGERLLTIGDRQVAE